MNPQIGAMRGGNRATLERNAAGKLNLWLYYIQTQMDAINLHCSPVTGKDDMSREMAMRINYKTSSVRIFCARERGEILPSRQ